MPITISGSTGIAGVDGSASTPAVQGTDTNTGIAFPAADTVAIGTGGTERMRVDSSGNVGIGTSSPNLSGSSSALTVNTGTAGNFAALELASGGTLNFYINANNAASYIDSRGSRPLVFQTNGSERARIDSSGNFQFNSGYGSAAVAYGCRAWVNFDGTGTVAIRASGNVTSITDNGTGLYTINFTTAMPDTNYAFSGTCFAEARYVSELGTRATSSVQIVTANATPTRFDNSIVMIAVFR